MGREGNKPNDFFKHSTAPPQNELETRGDCSSTKSPQWTRSLETTNHQPNEDCLEATSNILTSGDIGAHPPSDRQPSVFPFLPIFITSEKQRIQNQKKTKKTFLTKTIKFFPPFPEEAIK